MSVSPEVIARDAGQAGAEATATAFIIAANRAVRPTSTTGQQYPSPVRVFPRAASSSYSTDSHGCVVCPSTTPTGPTCGSNQERLLSAQSCSSCPKYYCSDLDDSGSKGPNIGGIVGGVVGGVAAVIASGLMYYFFVWKKRHPSLEDDEEIYMEDLDLDESKDAMSSESAGNSNPDKRYSGGLETTERPGGGAGGAGRRANLANRRLSSYESFTRPQAKFKSRRGQASASRRASQRLMSRNLTAASPYLDANSSRRNSVATTISTTNASNILPIAYIPGVTVRPTKNNTKSIYSYETDSIFSDLNTIENASIIGDIMRANYSEEPKQDNTMTAIKAQPRLISVDRIEEEDEDEEEFDDDYDGVDVDVDDSVNNSVSKNNSKTSIVTSTRQLNESTVSNVTSQIAEEDEGQNYSSDSDGDSDVDSDLGEIQRATSVRRNNHTEMALDLIDLGQPGARAGDDATARSDGGSFVLDVEIDHNGRSPSQTSGEKSPFEDP